MPANLNALVRYKTINSCLFGGRRRWTIDELAEACSEALAESRGRYVPVSERTLRDDLRVMKSDILGFNAPIVQERGCYYYSDPRYSFLNLRITDAGLADRIFTLLLSLRQDVAHPELESILEQLCGLMGKIYEQPAESDELHINEINSKICITSHSEISFETEADIKRRLSINNRFNGKLIQKLKLLFERESDTREDPAMSELAGDGLSWGYILEKIGVPSGNVGQH
jgi:hypothetical protein